MNTIILGNLTACSKIIFSLNECGIEFELVNTEIDKNYDLVPDNTNDIPVLGNIYNPHYSKPLKILRFLFGIPFFADLLGPIFSSVNKIDWPKSTDLILANWGAGIIPELNLLKEFPKSKNYKSILNLESFPTSWKSTYRERFEILMLKKSLRNIDALIVPTRGMRRFLINKIPEIQHKPYLISPYFFPSTFFNKNTEPDNPEKDLIFLGRLDSTRNLNDVSTQIHTLAKNNITISCVSESSLDDEKLYTFAPFKSAFLESGGLYDLAHQHKAALVTYLLPDLNHIPTRYSISIPHRILMPLALGLPVVLPKNYFSAMEELISEYNVGLVYSSIEELKDFLNGTGWEIAKNNLKKNQNHFLFDSKKFSKFFSSVASI